MEIEYDYSGNKGFRLLNIYERLNKGELVNKETLSNDFGVSQKTIQRDLDDLRAYLSETHSHDSKAVIKYDKHRNGYYLLRLEREWLTNEEVLAVSKILLESRAFCKAELDVLISKLLTQTTPNDRKQVEEAIRNEKFYYVPLKHNKSLLPLIWTLSRHIVSHEIIEILYIRKDGVSRSHEIKPVAIMFSEYYFYLIAFMADETKDYPTVFRIDRVENTKGLNRKFQIPYKDRFNDGEFRKRVQFMYSGELRRVTFEYSGPSIEAVLDRLPTAEILYEKDGVYAISLEVFGNGIDMWLRSQGDKVDNIVCQGIPQLK